MNDRNDIKGKHTPIRRKLMRVIMMVTGTVLVMTCAAFFTYEYATGHVIARRQVSTLGKIIATNTTAALAFNSREDAVEILNALRVDPNIVAACLYDTAGKLFAKYPADLSSEALPVNIPKKYHFKNGMLDGFEPVTQNGSFLGTLYLKSDMRELYERLMLYGVIALVFIGISFVFAYLLSRTLQKSISSPILELADAARMVSDHRDYSIRSVKKSDDEVGDLTDAFNHMLTRIEIQNGEIMMLNQSLESKVKTRTIELEEANAVLKQQTELVENIIDSSVDLVIAFDPELRFSLINKTAEKLYARPREQMIGHKIVDVFPQVRTTGMLEELEQALKGEMVRNVNYKSVLSNRHFENFYVPLKDEHNKVYLILTIAHDITGIMEANEKLQTLNEELKKSNQELEQFAYVASHDLQEPLRKIQIFSELSQKNIHNSDTLKKYLEKINSSASRMAELIKAVLQYSQVSRPENLFEPVDLHAVIGNILTDLELLINEKNAVVRYGQLPVIKGIPLQLNQLFLNLIANSLKFCKKTPEIEISHRVISVNEVQPGVLVNTSVNHLEIILSDNGIGFNPDYADKLFSIFQRLHTDKGYGGTGIGLSICKKIVENHNGYITAKSREGEGTSFYIYLPCEQ